jgi:hypothetical protein
LSSLHALSQRNRRGDQLRLRPADLELEERRLLATFTVTRKPSCATRTRDRKTIAHPALRVRRRATAIRLEALEERRLLAAVNPAGSLVYQDTVTGTLASASDVATYDLTIDPQQTLAELGTPLTSSMILTVVLTAPDGTVTATSSLSPGAPALIPAVQSPAGGTYKIQVSGGPGNFALQSTLDALVDPAAYGGPPDSTIATAQPLDAYANAITSTADRTAVLGSIQSGPSIYSLVLDQGESTTVVLQSLDGQSVQFALLDGAGNVLALSSPGAQNYTAGLNNFVAQIDAPYYVEVTGPSGARFNLVATRGADFSTQPNNSIANAQDITVTRGDGHGGALGAIPKSGTNTYAVSASAGDTLSFSTTTPAGGPGQFANGLFPALSLFDPSGHLLKFAEGNATDHRNSIITVQVSTAGTYDIQVSANDTMAPTQGEYGLSVTGETGALTAMTVTGTTPAAGALVQPATSYTVVFNHPVYAPSVTAGALTINGAAAAAASMVDSHTVTWTFPAGVIPHGDRVTNTIALSGIEDASGTTMADFTSSFTTDDVAPFVSSSSISDGATFFSPATITEVVTFNEPMDTAVTSASSFNLHGVQLGADYAATSFFWSPAGTALTIQYAALPADAYTLTLDANGFQDSVGLPLTSDYHLNFTVTTPPPPTVTPPADQTAVEGASQSFDPGSFTDVPGATGPWTVDVSWGDGTPDTTFQATATGSLGKQSHTYGEEGSKTVTVKVTDTGDGQAGSTTFGVSVFDPQIKAAGECQP